MALDESDREYGTIDPFVLKMMDETKGFPVNEEENDYLHTGVTTLRNILARKEERRREAEIQPVPVDFKLCKRCGNRIVEAWSRFGKKKPDGEYCSKVCADAVHGFDNTVKTERRFAKLSMDEAARDGDTAPPLAEVVAFEVDRHANSKPSRRKGSTVPTEAELKELAGQIDFRLPLILECIKRGMKQEAIGERLGISRARVANIIAKLKKAVS